MLVQRRSSVPGTGSSLLLVNMNIVPYRPAPSRVKFNTYAMKWSACMDTCPKYNRAMVPSYTSLAGLEELQVWSYNITTDPVTRTIYEDGFSRAFWLPFRSHHYIDKGNSICICLTLKWPCLG